MPYSNFTKPQADVSFLLEIDFGTGWEDWTSNLFDISIIEETVDDKIAGLTARLIEVRMDGLEPDQKWARKNLPIRFYISADGFQELVFNGVTIKGETLASSNITLSIVDSSNKFLHRSFGTESIDKLTITNSFLGLNILYQNDGALLPIGDNEEGGTVANTNYRTMPPNLPSGDDLKVRCNALINKDSNNKGGYYTINQMLKAMGCFGGFNKDGVFKLKKRVWLTPTEQHDLSTVQDFNSFQQISLGSEYSFNSITVEGSQYQHYINNLPFLNTFTLRKSQEINNIEVKPNSNSSFFLSEDSIPNILVCEGKTKGFFKLVASPNDDGLPSFRRGVYLSDKAYDSRYVFNGSTRYATASTPVIPSWYNFAGYTGGITIMAWIRPFDNGQSSQYIVSNRNVSDRGLGLRITPSNRTLTFVNHGIEALSSNTFALQFGLWQPVAITISSPFTGGVVKFYVNGNYISQKVLTSNLGSSTANITIGRLGNGSASFFNGSIQDLRIYNTVLFTSQIKEFSYIDLPESSALIGALNFRPGITGYWKIGEGAGSVFEDFGPLGTDATISGSLGWSTSSLNEKQRKYTDSGFNYLYSYSSDDFNQNIRYNVKNENASTAFVKSISLSGASIYQKIQEIKVKAEDYDPLTESEERKDFKSFYINDPVYAQNLADNLLSVYGDEEGFYQFDTVYLPRVTVGDIVKFKVYAPNSSTEDYVGVVLEKTTTITTRPFRLLDTLKVKKLYNHV